MLNFDPEEFNADIEENEKRINPQSTAGFLDCKGIEPGAEPVKLRTTSWADRYRGPYAIAMPNNILDFGDDMLPAWAR